MIFSLNVAIPWKIYSRLPLKTNSPLNILDTGLPSRIKLNRLTNLSILIKGNQDSKKKTVVRELSSCIIKKFNGFNIIWVEFSKKLRQPFRPIDIIDKPVKKCDETIRKVS